MKQGAERMQTKKVTVTVVHSTGKLRRATHIVLYVVSVRYGVTESILLFPLPDPPHSNSQRAHGMPKAKSRLLTYYAEPSGRSQRKFATLSNTSKRVRRVFTESTSSSALVEQQNQPDEALLDNDQPMIVDDMLDGTPADIDCPANISVHTKAKRYQNSV